VDTERDVYWTVFNGQAVYPEYMTDLQIMICPSDADAKTNLRDQGWFHHLEDEDQPIDGGCFFDVSYIYTAWVTTNDDDAVALYNHLYGVGSFMGAPWRVSVMDTDLDVGGKTFYRLREGIERFFITDINNPAASAMAQSEIPIMLDEFAAPTGGMPTFNHIPGGINALYLDGHVEWVGYKSGFPCTSRLANLFGLLG
jgi:prepilin-type processing-associated H-X9-DG protein